MNDLLTQIHSNYVRRLLGAFPKTLEKDVQTVLQIVPLDVREVKLSDGQLHVMDDLMFPENYDVVLNGEHLAIPYRVYFNEPKDELVNNLNSRQKAILHCIYLRHHNGYVRQRHLEKLADSSEIFVIPFSLQLLGEYVMEILLVLDKCIKTDNIKHYQTFVLDNPLFWRTTQKRVVSYWNEYYRRPNFPKLKDYIGTSIVNRLKKTTA